MSKNQWDNSVEKLVRNAKAVIREALSDDVPGDMIFRHSLLTDARDVLFIADCVARMENMEEARDALKDLSDGALSLIPKNILKAIEDTPSRKPMWRR